MHSHIEQKLREISFKPNKGVLFLLCALSQVYKSLIYIRHYLFYKNLLQQKRVSKPVISIGSIIAGGTGKTPLTYLLAKHLNRSVAILNGGYRAKEKVKNPRKIRSPLEGDEAYFLAQKLPFASVYVGKKRIKSAQIAEKEAIDYILLDDGMQHRYLARDIDIVTLHIDHLLGGNYFLPRGLLRDSPRRLEKVDAIFVNGVKTESDLNRVKADLKTYTKAPLIGFDYKIVNQEQVAGKKIGVFCGIAHPFYFFQALKSLGCQIVQSKVLPDHAYFDRLDTFSDEVFAKGGECIVCTEKDFVKIRDPQNIVPLRIEPVITAGKKEFDHLLIKINRYIDG